MVEQPEATGSPAQASEIAGSPLLYITIAFLDCVAATIAVSATYILIPTFILPLAKQTRKTANRCCELELLRDRESEGESLILSPPLCAPPQT